MDESVKEADITRTYLSNRGVFEYMDRLQITESDLNDPNNVILDLGAGIQQDFAGQHSDLDLKAKVISIDPRLGLPLKTDLAIPGTNINARLEGRKNAKKIPLLQAPALYPSSQTR